jgi:hypothetical protein
MNGQGEAASCRQGSTPTAEPVSPASPAKAVAAKAASGTKPRAKQPAAMAKKGGRADGPMKEPPIDATPHFPGAPEPVTPSGAATPSGASIADRVTKELIDTEER